MNFTLRFPSGFLAQCAYFQRQGERGTGTAPRINPRNQFALELDHMARCVREGHQPHTPGEEGLRDQLVMETIQHAAETGQLQRAEPAPAIPSRGPAPDPA